ncbi:MAG: hypothetical protein OES57_03105 [Acidimicrobiia bacterium]|nr:hypothetical protein [Acidimicrobiia bacterium]
MQTSEPTSSYGDSPIYRDKGSGWIMYAGVMLCLVGLLNTFQGLLLIAEDEIYVTGPAETVVVIGDVATWGWVILILGILEIAAGGGVLAGNQLARWFGIFVASVALLAQFPVFFGAYPIWSFTVVILCALVIYGLAAYGAKHDAEA